MNFMNSHMHRRIRRNGDDVLITMERAFKWPVPDAEYVAAAEREGEDVGVALCGTDVGLAAEIALAGAVNHGVGKCQRGTVGPWVVIAWIGVYESKRRRVKRGRLEFFFPGGGESECRRQPYPFDLDTANDRAEVIDLIVQFFSTEI